MQITLDELAVQQATCLHPNPSIRYTGSIIFENGDVVDTQTEHIFCPDCGAELTPAPVEAEIIF